VQPRKRSGETSRPLREIESSDTEFCTGQADDAYNDCMEKFDNVEACVTVWLITFSECMAHLQRPPAPKPN